MMKIIYNRLKENLNYLKNTLIVKKIHVYPYYNILLLAIMAKMKTWDVLTMSFIYYMLNIIPRIILLLIFMTDVFYVQHIEIFYYCILLGLLPLCYRYIKYSLEIALEYHIRKLEEQYAYVWILEKYKASLDEFYLPNPNAVHNDTYVSIRKYFEIQEESLKPLVDIEELIEYECVPVPKEETYAQYYNLQKDNSTLTEEDYDNLNKEFFLKFPLLFTLYLNIKHNREVALFSYKIPQVTILIHLLYFITWLYILVVSFHTLDNFNLTLNFLEVFLEGYEKVDPYSGIKLVYNHNVNNTSAFIVCLNILSKSLLLKIIALGFIITHNKK